MMFNDIIVEEDNEDMSNYAQRSEKETIDINIMGIGANFGRDLELDDVDIDLGDELQRVTSLNSDDNLCNLDSKRLEDQLKDFDFFGNEILSEAKQIMNEELQGLQNPTSKEDDEATVLSRKANQS